MNDDTKPNSNAGIERMMEILSALEQAPHGLSQAQIVGQTGLARSTAYRILNSLDRHGILRESSPGTYVFGSRLLQLAEKVTPSTGYYAMSRLLQPTLEQLAHHIGQTCKVSVVESGAIMLIAGASPKLAHALSYTIGEILPAHAGASSKVLMAHLPQEERKRLLNKHSAPLTERTIVDRREFEAELEQARIQGWAEDRGEYSLNVSAFAAPIRNPAGTVIAALSVPFLTTDDETLRLRLRKATIEGADELKSTIEKLTF
ncbi:IclR family transcriptional regulator [Martelella soudanensis]|uniref:IclR family transcriptional regulator n=1 Tax=unclassified Martelella TaxID=2629616 RepID=UPI0015DDE35D|nr:MULTISPECIES: IclR family transcriptional regulator [unclassified Martelella]